MKNKPYSKTKLYYIYQGIKNRCYRPSQQSYKYYGAKGITMCDEWYNDFKMFQSWAYSNGYIEGLGLSIDRIDVNGNYEPNNCRWATNKEQQNNRTDNHYITYNGQTLSIAQWCKELNVKRHIISDRLLRGWEFSDIVDFINKSS